MRDEQKQQNSTGAVQIIGDHNTVHQHTHQHQHEHVHNHIGPVLFQALVQPAAFALQASPAPPARQGLHQHPKPPKRDITPAQRECLALMRPLPKPVRVDVLIWMRVEFGTSLVMDLDPRELYRLRAHLAGVRISGGV